MKLPLQVSELSPLRDAQCCERPIQCEFGFSAYDRSDKSFPTLVHSSGFEGSEALNRSFGETLKNPESLSIPFQ
jgi:hypothetical protein